MPLKTHMDEQPTLNLTPMIDIVFLLIIFFMVGTKFTELERKIGLEVPQVTDHGTLTAAPEKRIVNVYRDGTITLDREPVTLDQLTQRLAAARAEYAELGVLIRGDGEGPYQNVANVFNACKHAGINQLAISVRPVTVAGIQPPPASRR
ncbi:MAG: biopolymer transporter ExbD [Pirellulales bacterium]|nr:biopolymer transporter ExbD [Pirellulales bacterium]